MHRITTDMDGSLILDELLYFMIFKMWDALAPHKNTVCQGLTKRRGIDGPETMTKRSMDNCLRLDTNIAYRHWSRGLN